MAFPLISQHKDLSDAHTSTIPEMGLDKSCLDPMVAVVKFREPKLILGVSPIRGGACKFGVLSFWLPLELNPKKAPTPTKAHADLLKSYPWA